MSDTETLKSNSNSDFNINLNEKDNIKTFRIEKNNKNYYFIIIYAILLICSIICCISVIILLNITGYDKTNIGHVIGIAIIDVSHMYIFAISTILLYYKLI